MWIRIGRFFAAAWLVAGPAAAGQASPKPPANDDCLACHTDHVDANQFAASAHGSMTCVDCHAALATVAEFPHADKVAKVRCAGCHDDVESKYRDSIHAWAKEKAGLVVARRGVHFHGAFFQYAHAA